jgi:hypothetical protein
MTAAARITGRLELLQYSILPRELFSLLKFLNTIENGVRDFTGHASLRACKGCYNLGHSRLLPLLKRFYAGI